MMPHRSFLTTTPCFPESLSPPPQSTRKKTFYLKLNVDELQVESTRTKLEAVWKNQMHEDRDPRINWELGWKAIK